MISGTLRESLPSSMSLPARIKELEISDRKEVKTKKADA
jgi:hypothetical protein